MKSDSPHGKWENTDISPTKLKTLKACPKQFEYRYIRRLPSPNGGASLQGRTIHMVFLEEYIVPASPYIQLDNDIKHIMLSMEGEHVDLDELDAKLKGMIAESNGNIDALVELMVMDLESRLETDDPRDYKSGLPLDAMEKSQAIQQLKVWGRGLLEAMRDGKDSYGNAVSIPEVAETEVEGCIDIELPSGAQLRLRGYIDLVFEDGSIGDLKLASDYWLAVWTLAKALGEQQPAMYAKMTGLTKFRYLIVDKKKGRNHDAYAPVVRTIDFEVTEKDMKNLIDDLEMFVRITDVFNNYKNGVFPCKAEYNGQTKATAGKTEQNFCGQLCSYKEICFNENFKR